jgi:Spy/CpxP family protein refolding chaperone
MNRKMEFWHIGLGLLFAAALLAPGHTLAKEERGGTGHGLPREQIVKELDLSPAKAKEFLAVGDKYEETRKGIIEGIKNSEGELEKALSAPKSDEEKIKGLVAAITAGHDQLFQSFKAQRNEEMALLTPVQQGKFLIALKKWHQEIREKYEKQGKKE